MACKIVLIRKETARHPEAATKHKICNRKYFQTEETLKVSEMSALMAPVQGSRQEDSANLQKRARRRESSGRCGKTGHNIHTYGADKLGTEDRYESE